jgi:hypothetical protein
MDYTAGAKRQVRDVLASAHPFALDMVPSGCLGGTSIAMSDAAPVTGRTRPPCEPPAPLENGRISDYPEPADHTTRRKQ